MAYSPWDHKELDMTECNHIHILDFPLFIEGSKNLRKQKYAFPVLKLLSSPIFRLKIIINFYLKVCLMSANYVKLWISYALFPLNSRGSHISSTMSFSQWFVLLLQLPSESNSLQPHGLQHTMPPYPSPSPRVCPSSCPLNRWFHPTICLILCHPLLLQPSVDMRWLFISGGLSIGVSASAPVLPISQ